MAENWIEGVIGIWVLLAPWLLGFADISLAKWSSVALGLVLILLNAWSLFAGKPNHEKGRIDQTN